MDVTEDLGAAISEDWQNEDMGVVVVVTSNICKQILLHEIYARFLARPHLQLLKVVYHEHAGVRFEKELLGKKRLLLKDLPPFFFLWPYPLLDRRA